MFEMLNTTITSEQFIRGIIQTIQMVSISLLIGTLLAVPLAITLVITRSGGVLENKYIYGILNPIVNIVRSIPFIILLVAVIPFTKLLVGTSIGTAAAIVPLTIHIIPYMSRLFENSFLEVNPGIIETAESMGASTFQIIRYFILPEALGSFILSITTSTIGLVGATAMAGAVGAGGIGDLAIVYGYQRFDTVVIFMTVIVLVIFVQLIQSIGNVFARKVRRH